MAYIRVTQQVLLVAYQTAAPVRVSSVAVEVIRSTSGVVVAVSRGRGFFQSMVT